MTTVQTLYGTIHNASRVEYYPSGALLSCIAGEASQLETPWGTLVPQYSTDEVRRRQLPAITFHENGILKSLPFETQTLIDTPAGKIPAEMITLHPNGALCRVFPLNGTLNGYWTQENETALAKPITLSTPLGKLFITIVGVHFCKSGTIRSLTLWPGTRMMVQTPAGRIAVRNGIAFHSNGKLESVEPDLPVEVDTPIGVIHAFNPDAVGITGDTNSLRFDEDGKITHVTTSMDCIQVIIPDGRRIEHAPPIRESYCEEAVREPVPMSLAFDAETLMLQSVEEFSYSLSSCVFSVKRTLGGFTLPKFVCSI